jgi:hypothetical protein
MKGATIHNRLCPICTLPFRPGDAVMRSGRYTVHVECANEPDADRDLDCAA